LVNQKKFGTGYERKDKKLAPRNIPRKQRTAKEPKEPTAPKTKMEEPLWTAKQLVQHREQLKKVFMGNRLNQCAMISYKHETKCETYWEEKIDRLHTNIV
jgi:hypothetical protein